MQGKMRVLSALTDVILDYMVIIGIKHCITYDIMVDKFNIDCKETINEICSENNIEWKVIPYPYVSISKKYDDINKQYYRTEKIGARIIFNDPSQNEYIEPSIKEYK